MSLEDNRENAINALDSLRVVRRTYFNDEMWDKIIATARRGVAVRTIYDSLQKNDPRFGVTYESFRTQLQREKNRRKPSE